MSIATLNRTPPVSAETDASRLARVRGNPVPALSNVITEFETETLEWLLRGLLRQETKKLIFDLAGVDDMPGSRYVGDVLLPLPVPREAITNELKA